MKKLVKRFCVPILVLVGLAMIAPQAAEAARWRWHARHGAYVHRPYYRVAPPIVPRPGVRVVAPGVRVGVGPGVRVYAPGVGVYVNPWYQPYYRGPSYYGW
jgi:hypothetical protein